MKKRNAILLVLLLVVGFAAVSTTLVLNGTIGVSFNDDEFNVIFTEANINGEGSSAIIDENTKQTITFSSSKLTKLNDIAILDYKIKNTSTQYDSDVTINCTIEESEYIDVTSELEKELITDDFKTTLRAQEEKSGVIKAKLIKSYTGEDKELSVVCKIDVIPTEKDEAVEIDACYPKTKTNGNIQWRDDDCSGDITVGDLITLGTESFYVIENNDENIQMLAKYNLEVGNVCTSGSSSSCTLIENPSGIQNEEMIAWHSSWPNKGVTAFSNTNYWNKNIGNYPGYIYNENSSLYEYIEKYVKYLNENYNVDSTGKLISYEQLENLGCSYVEDSCESAPNWVYSTSYWTGSANDYENVWHITYFGGFRSYYYYYIMYLGVRPVITISADLIK